MAVKNRLLKVPCAFGVSVISTEEADSPWSEPYSSAHAGLFPQAKSGYDLLITLDVFSAHVLEQCRAIPDHFEQSTS